MKNKLTSRELNSLLSLLADFIPKIAVMFLGMIKTRVIITYLGDNSNAIYNLLVQLSSFLMLSSLGIDAIFRINYYKHLNENDYDGVTKIYNFSKKYFNLVTFVMIIMTFILAGVLIYSVDEYSNLYLFVLMVLFCLPHILDMFTSKEVVLCMARERVYLNISIYNIFYIARLIVGIFVIYFYHDLLTFALIDIGLALLGLITRDYVLKRDNKKVLTDTKESKCENISLSKYILVSRISSKLYSNIDSLIITKFINLFYVSVYNSYFYIINSIQSILSSVTDAFLNSLGSLIASDEGGKSFIIEKYILFSMLIITFVFIPTVFGMQDFLLVWLGRPDYLLGSKNYFIVILIVFCLLTRLPLITLENASGIYDKTYKIGVLETIINIVVSIFGAWQFGITGIFLGTLISSIVSNYLKVNVLISALKLNRQKIYKNILLLLAYSFISIVMFMGIDLSITQTLVSWIFKMFIICVINLAVMSLYYCAFSDEMKEVYKYILKKIF